MEHNEVDHSQHDADAAGSLPSLSKSWSRRHDLAPMPWSLGVVGDLLWNVFPQLRTAIRDLIVEHIERAISNGDAVPVYYGEDIPSDDQLSLPESYDYITHIVRPAVLNSVANGSAATELVYLLCRYIRLLLTFDGQAASTARMYAEEIIEDIGTPQGEMAIASVDPELVGFIRGRLKMWRSLRAGR